jgi:hypothetical protein
MVVCQLRHICYIDGNVSVRHTFVLMVVCQSDILFVFILVCQLDILFTFMVVCQLDIFFILSKSMSN